MTAPKRRTIAIDCDDVIIATSPYVVGKYNEAYGTQATLDDVYADNLAVWQVASVERLVARMEAFLDTDEFQQVAPFIEAITSIKRLAKYHDLHIVTGRSSILTTATEVMLEQHFPDTFLSIEHAGLTGKTARNKGDVCVDIGADLLIDDHLYHAKQVAERGIDVLLFGDYPWNQVKTLPNHITRAQNWAEIEKILL
jgi:uncharacterized HAD superfamily protein